jgi:hypothetical protein
VDDLTTIWHRDTGRSKRVDRRQYDRLWKARGWRLNPPQQTSGTATAASTKEGDEPESKE